MIRRIYKLEELIKPNKVLVIYGPRRVGKTTLLNEFLSGTRLKYKLDSGDNIRIQELLGSQDFNRILEYASGYELIVIDEAQQIPNIGMGLKIVVDQIPGIMVIATGSSIITIFSLLLAIDFSVGLNDPVTKRVLPFKFSCKIMNL